MACDPGGGLGGTAEVWPLRPPLPKYIPMHPTQVREPFHQPGWVYEEKVDGWRILAYKDGATVRLVSRTGVEHSKRFRGIAEAIAGLSEGTQQIDGAAAADLEVDARDVEPLDPWEADGGSGGSAARAKRAAGPALARGSRTC